MQPDLVWVSARVCAASMNSMPNWNMVEYKCKNVIESWLYTDTHKPHRRVNKNECIWAAKMHENEGKNCDWRAGELEYPQKYHGQHHERFAVFVSDMKMIMFVTRNRCAVIHEPHQLKTKLGKDSEKHIKYAIFREIRLFVAATCHRCIRLYSCSPTLFVFSGFLITILLLMLSHFNRNASALDILLALFSLVTPAHLDRLWCACFRCSFATNSLWHP